MYERKGETKSVVREKGKEGESSVVRGKEKEKRV